MFNLFKKSFIRDITWIAYVLIESKVLYRYVIMWMNLHYSKMKLLNFINSNNSLQIDYLLQ